MCKGAEWKLRPWIYFDRFQNWLIWLWRLRGRKGKFNWGQWHSNLGIVYGWTALSQKERSCTLITARQNFVAQSDFGGFEIFKILTSRPPRYKRQVQPKSSTLKPWDSVWMDSSEPEGDLPTFKNGSAKLCGSIRFWPIRKTPKNTPEYSPKHWSRPLLDVFPSQGPSTNHFWWYKKNMFGQVVVGSVQDRGSLGWLPYGVNLFSGVENYHFFKTLTVDWHDPGG